MEDLNAKIDAANEKFFDIEETEQAIEEPISQTQPTDLLQQRRNTWYNTTARNARGTRPKAKLDMTAVENTGIKHYCKKARDDSDYYKRIGNKQYATMLKEQYMQDYFLPMIDTMVRLNGMEALLANKDVLTQLDRLVLLDGTRGNGYTESFIRSMYSPEREAMEVVERSDKQVEQAVLDIKYLCETDAVRNAIGRARDIKRSIDSGNNIASDDDYAIIQKVALYGE